MAEINELVARLRGNYSIPVNDGAGPLNGKMTVERHFDMPPICTEAADLIESLERNKAALATRIMELERERERLVEANEHWHTRIGQELALREQAEIRADCAEDAIKEANENKFAFVEWRDRAERAETSVKELEREIERARVQLAACGVIAGCNTRGTLSEQMPTPDAYGYSESLLDVAKAVTREMNERERAEASERNFAIEHDALVKAESALRGCMAHADELCSSLGIGKAYNDAAMKYQEWRAKQ